MRLTTGQGRHADLRVADIDDHRIDAMFLEDTGIARHPENAAALVETAEAEHRFVVRRCCGK